MEHLNILSQKLVKLTDLVKDEFICKMQTNKKEDQIKNDLRDDLVQSNLPELAAANIVRLAIHAASIQITGEGIYTDKEIKTISNIAIDSLASKMLS